MAFSPSAKRSRPTCFAYWWGIAPRTCFQLIFRGLSTRTPVGLPPNSLRLFLLAVLGRKLARPRVLAAD
jgi:hypothetical protein